MVRGKFSAVGSPGGVVLLRISVVFIVHYGWFGATIPSITEHRLEGDKHDGHSLTTGKSLP